MTANTGLNTRAHCGIDFLKYKFTNCELVVDFVPSCCLAPVDNITDRRILTAIVVGVDRSGRKVPLSSRAVYLERSGFKRKCTTRPVITLAAHTHAPMSLNSILHASDNLQRLRPDPAGAAPPS